MSTIFSLILGKIVFPSNAHLSQAPDINVISHTSPLLKKIPKVLHRLNSFDDLRYLRILVL